MSETDNRISYPIILYIKLGKDKVTAYNGRLLSEIIKRSYVHYGYLMRK